MVKRTIVLTIEGPDGNNGHVELSVFAKKIEHFLGVLNKSVKERGQEGIVFQVIRLSHSSPVTIECEPISRERQPSAIAVDAIDKNMSCVMEEKTRTLSHSVLSALEELANFQPGKIARAEVRILRNGDEGTRTYTLDDRFRDHLNSARRIEEQLISTIDGRLEQINIHDRIKVFRIYPSMPDSSSIKCIFPPSLLERVQNALGSFVSVSGACFYRPDAPLPYKVSVQDMEVLPPADQLPTLSDLHGIAPGATDETSSEQFVRELRDRWGKP